MKRWQDRIPLSWRRQLKLWQRAQHDRRAGLVMAKKTRIASKKANFKIEETQVIRPSSYFDNKVVNLNLGCAAINLCQVAPGEVFSFWHIVGDPSLRRGFREGRNLIGGRLQADFGGGLCQLSGMLYLLALRADLLILERHAHSVDIYQEEERFTPLGADATVVYGYRDLRFQNTLDQSIWFHFSVNGNILRGHLLLENPTELAELAFVRMDTPEGSEVTTKQRFPDSNTRVVTTNFYIKDA